MKRRIPPVDFSKYEGKTGREILDSLTNEQKERYINRIKDLLPPERFESLTESQLNSEIIWEFIIEAACSHLEIFKCVMSKETADFIYAQAEHYGISVSCALEGLIDADSVMDPELAAVLSIMNIENALKNLNEKKQIRSMFIIVGALINEIMKAKKYTFDETTAEAAKYLNEFRKIVDKMKKNED